MRKDIFIIIKTLCAIVTTIAVFFVSFFTMVGDDIYLKESEPMQAVLLNLLIRLSVIAILIILSLLFHFILCYIEEKIDLNLDKQKKYKYIKWLCIYYCTLELIFAFMNYFSAKDFIEKNKNIKSSEYVL